MKLKPCLETVKIYTYSRDTINQVNKLLYETCPSVAIVDDRIFNTITYPKKVQEGKISKDYLKRLINLADNLANYFRMLLKKTIQKSSKRNLKTLRSKRAGHVTGPLRSSYSRRYGVHIRGRKPPTLI